MDEDAQPVNFSEFDVTLKPSVADVSQVMRTIREKLAQIPGMSANVSQFISHRMSEILSGVRSQVVVKIYGQDFAVLQQKQQEIYAAIKDVAGIADLQMEPMILVPGIDIKVKREAAAAYGFTPGAIVSQVSQALNGVAVSRVLEQDRSFDIFLRVNEGARNNMQTLGGLPIISLSGSAVPLREVAQLVGVREPYMINRDDGARRAVVQWNISGRDLNSVVNDAMTLIHQKVKLPPGYSLELGGDYEGQQRATRTLLISSLAALLLITVIMYQAFQRWMLVLLVLMNLPLALIGGVIALAVAHETINVSSLVGMIALFGVATRNSLLLISRLQFLARQGTFQDITQVALQGAADRLMPILMTAFTAALAVIPLIIGNPTGKELERPLAIVLLGGMLSSTLLNLIVIPTLFTWMARRWPQHFTPASA